MKRSFVAMILALAAAVTAAAQPHKDNPQIGTWVMNIPKSTFSTGTGFKSAVSNIVAVEGGVKHTLKTIYADGTSRNYEYVTHYDGKDMPVIGNSPYGNTTALTVIDSHTTRTVYKKDGKVTVTQTSVVSSDGKTRTVTTTGTNPAGQNVHNVGIYDRQ